MEIGTECVHLAPPSQNRLVTLCGPFYTAPLFGTKNKMNISNMHLIMYS